MNTGQQTARVGLFFILGVALVWATYATVGSGKLFGRSGYILTAAFPTLKELKVGDEVRMAGVRIGAVEETRLTAEGAEAILRIEDGTPPVVIRQDAVATIAGAGLIPANYISISIGTQALPALKDGDRIATVVTADLGTVMAQLGEMGTKLEAALGGIGEAMGGKDGQPGLLAKLDKLVTDNQAKIDETMANVQQVTAKINSGEGTLGKLVNNPALYNDLVAALNEIKAGVTEAKTFMTDARTLVDQVKSGKGTLGSLLYDETAGNNIKVVTQNLRDVSDKIARGEGTLGMLLNSDAMAVEIQSTIKKANRALDSLEDAGPVNAVGVVAKSLF